MTVSRGTKWKTVFALLVAVATAAGCSTDTPPPAGVPEEHLALYEMIHDYRQDHEAALEMIVSGDDIAGRNLLASATDRLAVAAEVCSRTPGCDRRLFAEAAARVLDERLTTPAIPLDMPLTEAVREATERLEKRMILSRLAAFKGNRTATAESLGVSRKTLFNKMRQHQLGEEEAAFARG